MKLKDVLLAIVETTIVVILIGSISILIIDIAAQILR